MNYFDKKNIKSIKSFKLILILLAYIIIFWTLWNINIMLFSIVLFFVIINKIFNLRIMCNIFGCIPADKNRGGIVRCKRCNYPMYRIK